MLSKRGKKSQVCFLLVGSGDVWILEKKRNGKKKFGLTYLCIYFNFASSLIWNLLTLSYFSCYYPLCWLPLTLFNKNNYFRVAWCDVFNSILHQLLLFICVHTCNIFPLFFLQITGLRNSFWKGIQRKWSSIFIQYDERNVFQNIQKCGIQLNK